MNQTVEPGPACGVDGCDLGSPRVNASGRRGPDARASHELTIFSDIICPWCFVAEKNLERALESADLESAIHATWRPFELNPAMPKEGMNRQEYRSRKFGSWERSQALDSHVASVGVVVGINFRHDLVEWTPNTFDAHRLVWLAEKEGVQPATVDALFNAYFVEGRDVGDAGELVKIGRQAGISVAGASALRAGAGTAEVTELLADVGRIGAFSGVPTFVLDGKVLFSGALPPQQMVARLREAMVSDVHS